MDREDFGMTLKRLCEESNDEKQYQVRDRHALTTESGLAKTNTAISAFFASLAVKKRN
jgi:hypothetical protein